MITRGFFSQAGMRCLLHQLREHASVLWDNQISKRSSQDHAEVRQRKRALIQQSTRHMRQLAHFQALAGTL